jgi:hypothetical protein
MSNMKKIELAESLAGRRASVLDCYATEYA